MKSSRRLTFPTSNARQPGRMGRPVQAMMSCAVLSGMIAALIGFDAGHAANSATPLPVARPVALKTAPVRIQLALNRAIDGSALAYLQALGGGQFSASGVDVAMTSEGTSEAALQAVARGVVEMAVVDLNTLIRFRGTAGNPPVKAVFIVHNRSPHAIIARRSRGIASLGDLAGKKLGITPDNEVALQWPALARINKIDPAKVTVEKISPLVRAPMLSAGQIDAVTGLTFRTPVDLKDRGVPASDLIVLDAADFGYPLYGDAVVVNPAFAEKNPDAVRRFLAGLARGLSTAIAQPAATAARTLTMADPQTQALELARWQALLASSIVTPDVREAGLGHADPERLRRSIRLVLGEDATDKLKAEDIFDAQYLPAPDTLVVR